MRYNELDKFFTGFLFTCIPYKSVDEFGGLMKFGDVIITRIKGVKSQFFYKGYDIGEYDMPDPIQRELFEELPNIVKHFYAIINNDEEQYDKFLSEYNYFKETGRTTWL